MGLPGIEGWQKGKPQNGWVFHCAECRRSEIVCTCRFKWHSAVTMLDVLAKRLCGGMQDKKTLVK